MRRRGGRGRRVVPNPERIIWTSTLRLRHDPIDGVTSTQPARSWPPAWTRTAQAQGMAVATVNWRALPRPWRPTRSQLRLVADLVERTDGVWGEIRRAMAEDADDRLEAAEATAEAPQPPF